jgi:hypothetical protein
MIFHNKLRKGRVIRVDIPKDGIMAAIFLLPYIAMLILVPLISNCSACKILVYIIFYLSYIALILQDRTNVEFTSNEIIIKDLHNTVWVTLIPESQKHLSASHSWSFYPSLHAIFMNYFFKVCPSGRFAQTMKSNSFQTVIACEIGTVGKKKLGGCLGN